MKNSDNRHVCGICGKSLPAHQAIAGALVRDTVVASIREDHPQWSPDEYICQEDLNEYRSRYVHSLLASERGELSTLEEDVLQSIRKQDLLAANVEKVAEEKRTPGQRLADNLATLGGSWPFLIGFGVFLVVWIAMNSAVLMWKPVDPYPYILLNLILSCLAAIQAPVILMSQNRQEAKDRIRSEHDYQVNLKAELEIRHLHEKVDHLLRHQWERMAQMQEIQLEVLEELGKKR